MPTNNQKYTIKFRVDTADLKDAFGNLERMLLNIKSIIESLPTESIGGISKELSQQISSALSNVGLLTSSEKSDIGAGLKSAVSNVESAMNMLGKSKGAQQARAELQALLETLNKVNDSISELSSVQDVAGSAVSRVATAANSKANAEIEKAKRLQEEYNRLFGSINGEEFLSSIEEDQYSIGETLHKDINNIENFKQSYLSLKKELDKPFDLETIDGISRALDVINKGSNYYAITNGFDFNDVAKALGKNTEYIDAFDDAYTDLVNKVIAGSKQIHDVLSRQINQQQEQNNVLLQGQNSDAQSAGQAIGRTRNSTVTVKVKFDDNGVVDKLNSTIQNLSSIATANPIKIPAILVNDTINKTENGIELDVVYNYKAAEDKFNTEVLKPLKDFAAKNKIRLPIDFDAFKSDVEKIQKETEKSKKNNKSSSTANLKLSEQAKKELEKNLEKDNESISIQLRSPAGKNISDVAKTIHDSLQSALNNQPVSPTLGDIQVKEKDIASLNAALNKYSELKTAGGTNVPIHFDFQPSPRDVIRDIGIITNTANQSKVGIPIEFVPPVTTLIQELDRVLNIASSKKLQIGVDTSIIGNTTIPMSIQLTPSIETLKKQIQDLVSFANSQKIGIGVDLGKFNELLKSNANSIPLQIDSINVKTEYETLLKSIRGRKPVSIKFSSEGLSNVKTEYETLLSNARTRKPVSVKFLSVGLNTVKAEFESLLSSVRTRKPVAIKFVASGLNDISKTTASLLQSLRNRKPVVVNLTIQTDAIMKSLSIVNSEIEKIKRNVAQPISFKTTNSKNITFNTHGAVTTKRNVDNLSVALSESEPIMRRHQRLMEEVFAAESNAVMSLIQNVDTLNNDIDSGVHMLSQAMTEIKSWSGGNVGGAINTNAIEANISAMTATVTGLDLTTWSEKNKNAIQGLIDKVNALSDAYRLTGRFSEYKSALSSLSTPIKDIIKDEKELQATIIKTYQTFQSIKVDNYSDSIKTEYADIIFTQLPQLIDQFSKGQIVAQQFNNSVDNIYKSLINMMNGEDIARKNIADFNDAIQKTTDRLVNFDTTGYSNTMANMYNAAIKSAQKYEASVRSGGQTIDWYISKIDALIHRLKLQQSAEDSLIKANATQPQRNAERTKKRKLAVNANVITQLQNLDNYVDKISRGKIDLFSDRVRVATEEIRQLGQAVIAMCNSSSTGIDDVNNVAKQFSARLRETFSDLKTLSNDKSFNIFNGKLFDVTGTVAAQDINNMSEAQQIMQQIIDAQNKIFNARWTKGENGKSQWLQWSGAVKNAQGEVQQLIITYDEVTRTIRVATSEASKNASMVGRITAQLNKAVNNFVNYIGVYLSAQRFVSAIREGIEYVKQLDSAIAELQLVTKESDEAMASFTAQAKNIADAVASTTTEVVKSSTEWARLGYTMEESMELAAVSAKLAKAGFMELTDSTSQLTSALQGFYSKELSSGVITAGEAATSIADKMVEVGNNFAITSSGIGSSLQRSAAAMVAAGNDIDKTIALTTAGNVIAQDPESIGNALKVVSMRLRGTNAAEIAKETGEEVDGLNTSFSKLYDTIKNLTSVQANDFEGISILTDAGDYKDTYQILLEISKVWDQLSDANQAALLETMAGKTRGAVVAGILQNGEVLEKAYNASKNAIGATEQAMVVALDTIEAKQAKLANQTQAFWQDLINSNDVKRVITALTDIVELLDRMVNLSSKLGGIGSLAPIFSAIGGGSSLVGSLRGGVQSDTGLFRLKPDNSWSLFGATIGKGRATRYNGQKYGNISVGGLGISGKEIVNLERINQKADQILANYSTRADAVSAAMQRLRLTEDDFSLGGSSILEDIRQRSDALDGYAAKSIEAGNSLKTFGDVFKNFKSVALSALGSAAISAGISMVVSLVVKGIDYIQNYSQNAIKIAEENERNFIEQTKSYTDNIEQLQALSERYNELSSGVNDLGVNVSLTADEYKEYRDIVNNILSISPSLHNSYATENELLGAKADLINKAVEAQKKLNKELLYEQTIGSNAEEWLNGLGGEKDVLNETYPGLQSDSAKQLSWDIGAMWSYSNERATNTYDGIRELIVDKLEEELANTNIADESFYFDNYDAIHDNIDRLMSSLTPDPSSEKDFYRARNELQNWILNVDNYNESLSELETKVDDGLKRIVDSADKAEELSDYEREFAYLYAGSFDLSDLTRQNILGKTKSDASSYERIRSSIADYTNQLTDSYIGLYEEALKKLDSSDSTLVSDYENSLMSFLLGIQHELSDLGLELTVPDIGLKLGFFIEDENGNPTKTVSQKRNLVMRALADEDFDLDNITMGELNRMAGVAGSLPIGKKMTSSEMLNHSTVQLAKMRMEESSGYANATVSIESYLSALSIVNKTLLDNTQITQEEASVIREVIGAGADWSDAIQEVEDEVSGETKYIIKNNDALKTLITTSRAADSAQGKLAKSQDAARKKYYELTKELTKVISSTEEFDDATRANIYSLSDQISDVRRLIDSYATLEQQLLGTTNAFTEFTDAQSAEAENTWGSQFTGMINTFAENLEKGEIGSPTTLAAIEAILPKARAQGLTSEEQREETIKVIEQAIADGYLSVNDSGDVEFTKANWDKLLTDGLKNGALVGEDIGHYDLSEAISSLDDLAAAYGDKLSKEFLFALISQGSNYNEQGTNVLSSLIDDTSDKILSNIDDLTLAQQKYVETISNTASSADDIRAAYDDMVTAQENVDSVGREMVNRATSIIEYERELVSLDEALSNPDIDDASLEQLAQRYASVSESLKDIGTFDQLQLDLALGQLDSEIADYQEQAEQLSELRDFLKEQIKAVEDTGDDHSYLDAQLADTEMELSQVNDGLEDISHLRSEIFAKFSDDTTTVMDELESISKYEIDNKRFEVICDGHDTIKVLDSIVQKINRIHNAHITVDGAATDTATEGGSNATGTFGHSYANGKSNDLVGELGREMVVDPSTGRYYTVGDNGPEMVNLPANAIVFNARQTDDLLSKGRTSTRGKALADGNASKKKLMSEYRSLVAQRTEAGPNYVGNVDINNRPIVLNSDGSYSTTSTSFQEGWYGDEASGGYRIAHYTPILPDGTWLSDEAVGEYIYSILQQQDPMSADANGYGIVYKIDTEIDGQKITDANLQAAFEMADAWDVAMHELQNAIYSKEADLKQRLYGSPSQRMFGNSYANGKANDLVGELGRELVIDPSTGHYYTVGDNGPEMVDLPADAVVFNAKQTDDILSDGKALVNGNAFAGGLSGGGTGNAGQSNTYWHGTPTKSYTLSWRNGASETSSSTAQAEAADWYEAFEKAYNDLKKLRDDDVIDADEYYRRLQALYTDYFNKYGAANEENADKLRDAWKQMYEDEKSDLEDRYNNNEMGTREYLDRLRNLYQRFYKDIPGFAKEAARAQKEYLNVLKGEYDKLFSAAVSIIGRRISALQDEYNERVEALEKEQEAANKEFERQIKAIDNQIKAYEKQIKAVQKQIKVYEKEIEAIQKANEERQDAIDLQKAQYELARAQNQRTQHIYTSEKGFVYRANPQDIKTAQDNLEAKEQEARVKSIQKEIDALQEVVDGYNEKIELLNEEKERIQELQEATNEYYENAIQAVRDYYEPMIKNLEKTQQMWQDFIDAEELAENIGVFKEFGITVDQVLNSTAGDIDIVKKKYAELLAAYYADNPEMLSAWSDVIGTDLANVVTNIDSLGTSLDGFGTHLAGMTQPWGEVMHTLGSVPEELTTVVNQSVNAITAGQEPIDHYIQYILQFEDAMREAGVTIGDFWQANGELKAGIDQGAFEMYVTSWNKLNEELGKAPGNIEPTSAALKAIIDSSITREQVDNYSQWLNEMSAHMPGISQSVGEFASNDLSGVTGNMATMLSDSNVKNALDLGTSLPTVAGGITEMSGADLTGALSLSDILSDTNANNIGTIGGNIGTIADGVNKMSQSDISHLSDSFTTLGNNAGTISTLANDISNMANAMSGVAVPEETLANFQAFVEEFLRVAEEFKTEVVRIFGGGEEAEGGTNTWFQGMITAIDDLNMAMSGGTGGAVAQGAGAAGAAGDAAAAIAGGEGGGEGMMGGKLGELLQSFITFQEQLTAIIGEFGSDDESTIMGALLQGQVKMGLELDAWILVFQGKIDGPGGIAELCTHVVNLFNEMATQVQEKCGLVTSAISNMLAEAEGTTSFSVLGHTITIGPDTSGGGGGHHFADGTAHANGTALADGRWGLKKNQRGTLVGELGPETLIRNGQYTIIGATGPERMNLKRGDIILNHRQTEQVFKYGKATGRGKAYASGTVNRDVPGLIHTTMPTGFDRFVSIIKDIGADIKVMKPELHHIELAVAGAGAGVGGFGGTTTNTIENINVSLPNFNSSKADDLINDLQSLSLQAIQRFNRK